MTPKRLIVLGPWNPFRASLERDSMCGLKEPVNAGLAFYPEMLCRVFWHGAASFPSMLHFCLLNKKLRAFSLTFLWQAKWKNKTHNTYVGAFVYYTYVI